jgi:hypothetical protein
MKKYDRTKTITLFENQYGDGYNRSFYLSEEAAKEALWRAEDSCGTYSTRAKEYILTWRKEWDQEGFVDTGYWVSDVGCYMKGLFIIE